MFDLKEMVVNALAGHAIGLLGIPGIIGLAAAGLVGWKLMQGARKPMLLLALLGIGAGLALWSVSKGGTVNSVRAWLAGLLNPGTTPPPPPPHNPEARPTGPAPEAAQQPSYAAMRDYWRQMARYAASLPMKPLPRYTPARKDEPQPGPLAWPQRHTAALKKLEADRWVNITRTPESYRDYLHPAAREQRHQERLAKEFARQRGAALLARAEEPERGFASIAPSPPPPVVMTPAMARAQRFEMQERRIDQAQALLATIQRRHSAPPQGRELAWRNPYRSW